jgi:hypothetical protein
MSLIRRALGALLPLGSTRRAQTARFARNAGFLPAAKPSEYERWIATVEPWQFSSATDAELAAVSHLAFRVNIHLDGATPTDVERSILSLGDQTHTNWTVAWEGSNPSVAATVARLVIADSRLQSEHVPNEFLIALNAGDTLAPQALYEAARATAPNTTIITGDHDSLNQFSDRRTTPRRHFGADFDAVRQFDPRAGFVARRSTTDEVAVLNLILRAPEPQLHVHVPLLLLHRRHRPGPIQRVLPGTDVAEVQVVGPDSSLVHRGAVDLGTQVRWRDYGSTPVRVGVVITDPITDRQRADLVARVSEANAMFASMPGNVSVVVCDDALGSFPLTSAVVSALQSNGANYGFVLDGALRIQSADIFADLLGVAARADSFAVAPIVVAPSGVVIDAGLDLEPISHNVFVARCGPLRRPPYSLLWTRAVASLSGRCIVASLESLRALADRPLSPDNLFAAATAADKSLVIWPHHQVVATYAMSNEGDTPAALLWRHPRLMTWFGPDIAPYSPLNDSASESVW